MKNLLSTPARKVIAAVLVLAVIVAAAWYVFTQQSKTITAQFESAKGVYAGDSVRMLGVEIGRIDSVTATDGRVDIRMKIDNKIKVPVDANALLVAQSLVAERFVQLTPVFTSGEELPDDGVIPVDHTAVPVEWDGVKEQLLKLSSALGPSKEDPKGSLSTFVDSADSMLDGNGTALRNSLQEVSRTMSVMSDGREDLFSTLRNLQLFVTALSQSQQQIVSFGGKLANVTQVLSDQTGEIDAALKDLDLAVADIQRFITNNGSKVTTSIDKLGQATKVVRDRRADVENLLHVAPTSTANFYNIYHPYQGTLNGALAMSQMGSPVEFVCGAISALENPSAQADASLCAQYLGPFLNTLQSNYPYGMAASPYTPIATPEQILPMQKPGTQTAPGVQPASAPPDQLSDVVNAGTDLTGLLVVKGGR